MDRVVLEICEPGVKILPPTSAGRRAVAAAGSIEGMRSVRGGLVAALVLAGCGGEVRVDGPDGSAPIGALRVKWSIVSNVDGSTLACADVGVTDVAVRLGGEPIEAPCADGEVVVSDLIAQRYPVLVQLKLGAVTLAEGRANVDVVAGPRPRSASRSRSSRATSTAAASPCAGGSTACRRPRGAGPSMGRSWRSPRTRRRRPR